MKDSLSNSLKDFCLVFANTHSITPVDHTGKGSPTKLQWYIWIVKVNLSCVSCFFTIKVTLYRSLYSVVPTLSLSLTRPCIYPRSYFQKRRRDTGKWLVTYSRLCILYSVLCTLYSVLCTLYSPSTCCSLWAVWAWCTNLTAPSAHTSPPPRLRLLLQLLRAPALPPPLRATQGTISCPSLSRENCQTRWELSNYSGRLKVEIFKCTP